MSEVTTTNAEFEQLRRLIPYLDHESPVAQAKALLFFHSVSGSDEGARFLQSLEILPKVVSLIASADVNVSTNALDLLVNMSAADDTVRASIVAAEVLPALFAHLVAAARVRSPLLALMLLVNLTRDEDTCRLVMQEGLSVEGLNATRLVRWFGDAKLASAPVPASAGTPSPVDAECPDPWAFAGDVLANLSQLESFRAMVSAPARRLFSSSLLPQMSSKSVQRRIAVYRILHNMSNDPALHAFIVDPTPSTTAAAAAGAGSSAAAATAAPAPAILPLLLAPIIAFDAAGACDAEDLAAMPAKVQMLLASPSKIPDECVELRTLVYETVLNLARNPPARAYLRTLHTYQVLREAHKHEKASGNEKNDDIIENDIIPFFILDDEAAEGTAPGQTRAAAAAIVAEESLALLRRMADGLTLAEAEEEAIAAKTKAAREAEAAGVEEGEDLEGSAQASDEPMGEMD